MADDSPNSDGKTVGEVLDQHAAALQSLQESLEALVPILNNFEQRLQVMERKHSGDSGLEKPLGLTT